MPNPSPTVDHTPQSRCRFALAWGDITPPDGIYHRMWGAAKHERATGLHRPLRVTLALFAPLVEGGGERQFVLALDHCVLGAVEQRALVAHTAQGGGVKEEEILVAFSHTHGAGLMSLDRVSEPGGDLIPGYLESIAEVSVDLVKRCLAAQEPAAIVYGKGRCSLARHRDFWDGERQQWVCGFTPDVPADDTVTVARVTALAEGGKTLACVVNYACHPTTLAWENTLVSPDYIGALRELVEREMAAPCLFLQGASGELGPREGFVGDPAVADRNGRELGYAALAALTALPPAGTKFVYTGPVVSGATLGDWEHQRLTEAELAALSSWRWQRWQERLAYRADQPTLEETQAELADFQSKEAAARAGGDGQQAAEWRAMVERRTRLLGRMKQLPPGDSYPLNVVLWHMGGAVWLGVQGESYSLLQTELRRRFPGKMIVVTSITTNWGASYLPPRELYDSGIYQESIAVVAPGSLEHLIDAIARRIA